MEIKGRPAIKSNLDRTSVICILCKNPNVNQLQRYCIIIPTPAPIEYMKTKREFCDTDNYKHKQTPLANSMRLLLIMLSP